MDQDTFERGPREHLQGFVELLSRLRGGSSHYLPMLLIKLDNIGRTGAAQQTPVTPISATTMSHTSAAAVVGIDGNPFGGLATDLHGVPMQSVSAAFLEPGGSQFQSFGSAAGMADPCHGGIEASYSRAPDYSLPAASIPLIASQSSFIPISNIAGTTPLPTPLLPSQPIQPIRRTAGPIRRGSSGMGVTSAVAPPASKGSSRQRTARHTPGQTPLHTPQLSTAAIASPSNSHVAHYQSTPPPLLNVRQQNIAMCSSPMQLPVPVTFAEALMGSPYLAGNPSLAHAQLQADAQAHAETHISPLAQVEDHLNTHLLPTAEHFQALQEHYNLHSPYGPL